MTIEIELLAVQESASRLHADMSFSDQCERSLVPAAKVLDHDRAASGAVFDDGLGVAPPQAHFVTGERQVARGRKGIIAPPNTAIFTSDLAVQVDIALEQREILQQLRLGLRTQLAEDRHHPFLVAPCHTQEVVAA